MPLIMGSNGMVIQTIAQIRAELAADLRTALGSPTLAAESDDSVIGQIVGILAERERLIQEAAQAVYLAFTREAGGVSLERVAELVQIQRKAATPSTVTVRFTNPTGAPIAIPAGAVLEITTTGDRFVADSLLSAPAGGFIDGSCTAHEAGPIPVPLASVWAFVSTFAGSANLTLSNTTAGEEGLAVETDAAMNVRWSRSYHYPGAGPLDSLIAGVLALDAVAECAAFENTTNVIGITTPEPIAAMPAKSFAVVTRGGAAADIGAVIWSRKPAGIESWGSATVAVVDAQGVAQAVQYTPATQLRLYLDLTVTGGSVLYDTAVATAVAEYVDGLAVAADPLKLQILCVALAAAGPEATNVTITHLHTAPSGPSIVPAGDAMPIPWNQWAGLAVLDVTVTNV